MRQLLAALFAAIVLTLPTIAEARLGDTQNNAEAFANRQGAVRTFIQTNAKGKVEYESWQAPPEMWSKAEADKVRELMTRGNKPVRTYQDGSLTIFLYKDKSQAAYGTTNGKVIFVKAKAAGSTAHF